MAMRRTNTISVKQAQRIAREYGKDVSIVTIIVWVEKHGLGHQPGGEGGRWYIFEDKFRDWVSGKDVLEGKKANADI